MKRSFSFSLPLIFTTIAVLAQSTVAPHGVGRMLPPDRKTETKISAAYGKLPLSFEENQGQTDPSVKFLSRGSGYSLFLTGDEAVFSFSRKTRKEDASKSIYRVAPRVAIPEQESVLRMELVKANHTAKVMGSGQQVGNSNYFIGNDPKKWHSNVPEYEGIKYENVYPGIDLLYYGTDRQLEYDFVVAPGADAHRIRFDVHGAKRIVRSKDGDLILHMPDGEIRWHAPVIFQEKAGHRQRVQGRYIIRREQVSFDLGRYDSKLPLTIDPALAYSTYLGGSGNDIGEGIAVDSSGNVYITGQTQSIDFPVTVGAFQTTCGGCYDAFVTKLNPSGSASVYSTYLGGSNTDYGLAIAVDNNGDAYVTGDTMSPDFPVTAGALQSTCNGGNNCSSYGDGFVTELTPSGSGLVYSTFLGGSGLDQGQAISVDPAGHAYVAGLTAAPDFPITSGAFQTIYGGGNYDAFISELNATGTSLLFSTFIGGSDADYANSIVLDSSGNSYVSGQTCSTNFPVTPASFQTNYGGGTCEPGDAFVAKLNSSGSALIYSTYLGGSANDGSFGIALDSSGDVYVTGFTCSSDFPITSGSFQTSYGGGGCIYGDAFVSELNASGSDLIYSTYLGGSNTDLGTSIAVDGSGDAYLTGQTQSKNFPTTPGAFQAACSACYASFVTELNPTGSGLIYSTYLSGSGVATGNAIILDPAANAYVTGGTSSTDFPITPNAYQAKCAGGCAYSDAFVSKFIRGPQLWPLALGFGNQTVGINSAVQNITFTNSDSTTLNIATIGITGMNVSDFKEVNNCNSSLAVGGSCLISVTFIPTASGYRAASVSVNDDGPNSPQMVQLNGVGVLPAATFSPTSLVFSVQTVYSTSPPQKVTLTNTGLGILKISGGSLTGQFGETNNCEGTLAPGASCSAEVTFKPKSKGTLNGTIAVTDNAPGSPQKVSLTGVGTYVQITPASVNFGSQPIHTTSLAKTITVTNKGSATVHFSGISIMGADPGDFAETNNCGNSVASGASCLIKVKFTPSKQGSRTADVSISDDGGGSPQVVPLSGTGTP